MALDGGRGFSPALLCILVIAGSPVAASDEPLRILFIGNSLTASNDLPNLVASLAQSGGHESTIIRTFAVGGFSLEDHWNQGDAQRAIAQDHWDFVVLQQGPSALMESRRLLVEYARRFAAVARAAGATPALYMVWPSKGRTSDFPGVSTSYSAAARAVKGRLLPAGDAWRKVLREHRDIALYSDDGLHPTLAGSYLAALVIYRELYRAAVTDLPPLGLPENDARRLKSAVTDPAPPATPGAPSVPRQSPAACGIPTDGRRWSADTSRRRPCRKRKMATLRVSIRSVTCAGVCSRMRSRVRGSDTPSGEVNAELFIR